MVGALTQTWVIFVRHSCDVRTHLQPLLGRSQEQEVCLKAAVGEGCKGGVNYWCRRRQRSRVPVCVPVCDVAMLILRFILCWLSSNQLPCFFTGGVRESALVRQIILSFAVNVFCQNRQQRLAFEFAKKKKKLNGKADLEFDLVFWCFFFYMFHIFCFCPAGGDQDHRQNAAEPHKPAEGECANSSCTYMCVCVCTRVLLLLLGLWPSVNFLSLCSSLERSAWWRSSTTLILVSSLVCYSTFRFIYIDFWPVVVYIFHSILAQYLPTSLAPC